jgi:hypothetical protein
VITNTSTGYWVLLPLGVSVGASVIAMSFGNLASRVAKYALPLDHEVFFNADGSSNIHSINKYRDSTEIMFFNTMIHAYLDGIRMNRNNT